MESRTAPRAFETASENSNLRHRNRSASLGFFARLGNRLYSLVTGTIVSLGTLPYYRFYRQNTLFPILHIVKCLRRGDSEAEIVKIITHWRERKLYELQFIQVASTILAAGVVGCFSWPNPLSSYWLGPALWYSSLVLSILALLLSSSLAFIFSSLNPPTAELHSNGDYRRYLALIVKFTVPFSIAASSLRGERAEGVDPESVGATAKECSPRWKMVFTWQAPMMFMAYGVCFYIVGLTLYVCGPFFEGEVWTAGTRTAYFYLTILTIAGAIFSYCSFWAYKFIDLDKVVNSD